MAFLACESFLFAGESLPDGGWAVRAWTGAFGPAGLDLKTPILTVGLSAEVLDAGFSSVAWLTKVARGGVTRGTGGRLATNVGSGLAAGSGAALATDWGC